MVNVDKYPMLKPQNGQKPLSLTSSRGGYRHNIANLIDKNDSLNAATHFQMDLSLMRRYH